MSILTLWSWSVDSRHRLNLPSTPVFQQWFSLSHNQFNGPPLALLSPSFSCPISPMHITITVFRVWPSLDILFAVVVLVFCWCKGCLYIFRIPDLFSYFCAEALRWSIVIIYSCMAPRSSMVGTHVHRELSLVICYIATYWYWSIKGSDMNSTSEVKLRWHRCELDICLSLLGLNGLGTLIYYIMGKQSLDKPRARALFGSSYIR